MLRSVEYHHLDLQFDASTIILHSIQRTMSIYIVFLHVGNFRTGAWSGKKDSGKISLLQFGQYLVTYLYFCFVSPTICGIF